MTKMRKNEFYWRKCENDAVPRRFAPRLTLLSSALDLFWKAVTHVTALYLQQRVHISLSFHWFIIGAFSSPTGGSKCESSSAADPSRVVSGVNNSRSPLMLASSKSLHDAAIFPHFLNSRTQRFGTDYGFAKVQVVIGIAYILLVGRWGLVEPEKTSRACLVHITRITTAPPNRLALSLICVIQWTAGGGNDGGKATIAAYTFDQ